MTAVWIVSGVLLVVAAAGAVYRLVAGPTIPDRLVATEMAASVCLSGMAAWAAYSRNSAVVAATLALALLGFIGSIAVPILWSRDHGGEMTARSGLSREHVPSPDQGRTGHGTPPGDHGRSAADGKAGDHS